MSLAKNISRGITVEDSRLQSMQRMMALVTILLPFLITLVAILLLPFYELANGVITTLLIMHLLTMLGITVGYHRLAAHRAFKAVRLSKCFLLILGTMSAQGPICHWVSNHRRHHEFSDKPDDVHSPYHRNGNTVSGIVGLWHAHVGWMLISKLSNPNRYCKDILRDKDVNVINKYYLHIVIAGLLLPGVICFAITPTGAAFLQGVVWGGFVRLFTVHHSTWAINSITHRFGSRSFDTDDHSTNCLWLALPSAGEAWHNSHHAFPTSARFGLKTWQLDIGYLFIIFLKLFGLVSDVRLPKKSKFL